MLFAATSSTNDQLATLGVPGLVVVVLALVGVVVYLYKDRQRLQDKYDARAEAELVRVMDTRDKLLEPLEKQAQLSEKIYDIVLRNSGK